MAVARLQLRLVSRQFYERGWRHHDDAFMQDQVVFEEAQSSRNKFEFSHYSCKNFHNVKTLQFYFTYRDYY